MKWETFFTGLAFACLVAIFGFVWLERWGPRHPGEDFDAEVFRVRPTHAVFESKDWLNLERGLSAEDLKGRILLLVFHTSSSLNFQHIHPQLEALYQKQKEKMEVLLVHSPRYLQEESLDFLRHWVIFNQVDFPVVHDKDLSIWRAYGIKAWPTMVLLDPEGRVRTTLSGERTLDELNSTIQQLEKEFEYRFRVGSIPYALERAKRSSQILPLHYPTFVTYMENYQGAPALMIADTGNHQIKGVRLDGSIVFEAGTEQRAGLLDGSIRYAKFNFPRGLIALNQDLYVADTSNHAIRRIDFKDGVVETLMGNGRIGYLRSPQALKVEDRISLASPWDVEVLPGERQLAISMAGAQQIWRYHLEAKELSVLVENPGEGSLGSMPAGLSQYLSTLYFADAGRNGIGWFLGVSGAARQKAFLGTGPFAPGSKTEAKDEAHFQYPQEVIADKSGVFIADTYNHVIRRYDPLSGKVETLAGGVGSAGHSDGVFSESRFNNPQGMLKIGEQLFVVDTFNHVVRVLDLQEKRTRTLGIFDHRLKQPKEAVTEEFSDLSGLESHSRILLDAGQEITLTVTSEGQAELHRSAPSELTLYREQENGRFSPLLRMDLVSLQNNRIALPKVEKGVTYRLRGSLFFCDSSQKCYVNSPDYTFLGAETGDQQINIRF